MNKDKKVDTTPPKQIAEYSVDYDMSMVIKYVFRIFGILMGGLLGLEILHIVLHVVTQGAMIAKPIFLTSEIVHTAFGFTGGWAGNIVTNFFAKMIAEKLSDRKEKQAGTDTHTQTEA